MKSNSKVLTVFPKARYIVENRKVKMISSNGVVLNISEKQSMYNLLDIIWAKGIGKQYV